MQAGQMTSRERVLAALRCEPVDYAPCTPTFCDMQVHQRLGLPYQFPWGPSQAERLQYCVSQLGVDPVVEVSLAGAQPAPEVSSKVWIEGNIIHKVYATAAGDVEAAIRYDENWPHGFDIPLYSDFNPSYATKFWIQDEHDLECFRHILQPVDDLQRLEATRFYFNEARRLADRWNLATRASCGLGLTGALPLFGPTQLCMMTVDNPALVDEYLEIEHQVNLRNLEIAAELGADIITRNGFYETGDFYSPVMLHDFLYDRLQAEIALAHQGGIAITYTVHTGIMPMLDYLRGLDFDCLNSVAVGFPGVDLEAIRDSQQGTKSFWTGPNDTDHTQAKDPEIVREVVREVFGVFGTTGLLLTPCNCMHSMHPWANFLAMVDEWQKLRAG